MIISLYCSEIILEQNSFQGYFFSLLTNNHTGHTRRFKVRERYPACALRSVGHRCSIVSGESELIRDTGGANLAFSTREDTRRNCQTT